MVIKTKKYKLETNLFVRLGIENILREWWWVWFVPLAIMLIPIFVDGAFWWCFGITLTLIILYFLFWGAVFMGMPQLEQTKVLFERLWYEIDSRQILVKVDAKRGMQMSWDQIKKAKSGKDFFLLTLSRFQFIYLPHDIFKMPHEIKFFETLLKNKNLIKVAAEKPKKVAA